MMRPTSVEPVNAILSMSGWFTISSPVRPSPVTTLSTPGGSPASCAISAKHSAVSGVNSAGFQTTGFPPAGARGVFHPTIRRGEVQGGAPRPGGGGGVDDVDPRVAISFDPAPADEQSERTVPPGDPLEGRLVALGRRPVGHRFEDFGDRGHVIPSGDGVPPSSVRSRSARAGARYR